MAGVLAKVVTGIDENSLAVDSCGFGTGRFLAEKVDDGSNNIFVRDAVWSGAGSGATGVRTDQPHVEVGRDVRKFWIVAAPGIVQQVSARTANGLTHLVTPRVDTDEHRGMAISNRGHEVNCSAKFFVEIDRVTWPGLDPSDVDDLSSRCHGSVDGGHGPLIGEREARIVKGIGGSVDDGHDEALVGRKAAGAEVQGGDRHEAPHGLLAGEVPAWDHRDASKEERRMMWILWLVVISVILLGVVLLALGRGDGLVEEEPDDVVVRLPQERIMVASDVEALRLPLAVRGYQMAAVDEVLDRLAAELALRDAEIRQLQAGAASTPEE